MNENQAMVWRKAIGLAKRSIKWHEIWRGDDGEVKPWLIRHLVDGLWHIGYGHLDDNLQRDAEITIEDAESLLGADIGIAIESITKVQESGLLRSTDHLGAERRAVLIELAFCLGESRLAQFEQMFYAINGAHEYPKRKTAYFTRAAYEILMSKAAFNSWHFERSNHMAEQMRTGTFWMDKGKGE